QLLRGRIRKEDTAGRIGLGAFGLSLPGGQEAGIITLVDWLRGRLAAEPPVIAGQPREVRLLTAVMSPLLDPSMDAAGALEAIQQRLEGPPEIAAEAAAAPEPAESAAPAVEAAAPVVAPPAPAPVAQPAAVAPTPAPAAPTVAPAPPAAAPATISVDEVLARI